MPYFDIIKKNNPQLTFRTSKIQADYDVKFEHSCEHFKGNIELPNEWRIGVLVGGVWNRKDHHSKRSVRRLLHKAI